jgi:SAM-dependent methyltransferase
MTTHSPLIDINALARNRARARPDLLYLHSAAAEDVQDRLSLVNKRFTSMAVVTPFPEIWKEIWPRAHYVPDTEALALEVGAHDLVVHGLCLQWSNDPVGQLIQCRRALKPDGLMIATLFGGQTLNELRVCLSEAEVALTGGLSPRIAPMGEIRDLGALLQRAGFALPVADSTLIRGEYPSMTRLMLELRGMGEGNALTGRSRVPTRSSLFEHAGALYVKHYGNAQGRISATFEFVTLTGWAPDDSQQQPLRPGSARQRLADALAVPEIKLPD